MRDLFPFIHPGEMYTRSESYLVVLNLEDDHYYYFVSGAGRSYVSRAFSLRGWTKVEICP